MDNTAVWLSGESQIGKTALSALIHSGFDKVISTNDFASTKSQVVLDAVPPPVRVQLEETLVRATDGSIIGNSSIGFFWSYISDGGIVCEDAATTLVDAWDIEGVTLIEGWMPRTLTEHIIGVLKDRGIRVWTGTRV